MAGAAARRRHDHEAAAHAAWMTAALVKTAYHAPKKFPPWEKIAPKSGKRSARRKTAREIQAVAQLWNALRGGERKSR